MLRILAYIKIVQEKLGVQEHGHVRISRYSDSSYTGDQGDKKFTTGYYIFVEENLVIWKSKKQDIVSRLNAEAEYKAMAYTACEMVWLKNLLVQLGPMSMHCDNQSAIYIAHNPVFHERTKHI